MADDAVILWERQTCDDDESWKAFVTYRDQLPPRRLIGYGKGVSNNTLSKWYRDNGWRERVAAYDNHLDEIQRDEREKAVRQRASLVAAQQADLLTDAREILTRELEKLLSNSREIEGSVLQPREIIRLLEQSIKLDRLIHGETTENNGPQVDLSKLSTEELKTLHEIQRKLATGP